MYLSGKPLGLDPVLTALLLVIHGSSREIHTIPQIPTRTYPTISQHRRRTYHRTQGGNKLQHVCVSVCVSVKYCDKLKEQEEICDRKQSENPPFSFKHCLTYAFEGNKPNQTFRGSYFLHVPVVLCSFPWNPLITCVFMYRKVIIHFSICSLSYRIKQAVFPSGLLRLVYVNNVCSDWLYWLYPLYSWYPAQNMCRTSSET